VILLLTDIELTGIVLRPISPVIIVDDIVKSVDVCGWRDVMFTGIDDIAFIIMLIVGGDGIVLVNIGDPLTV